MVKSAVENLAEIKANIIAGKNTSRISVRPGEGNIFLIKQAFGEGKVFDFRMQAIEAYEMLNISTRLKICLDLIANIPNCVVILDELKGAHPEVQRRVPDFIKVILEYNPSAHIVEIN